jgi:hypothetical protein
MKDREDSGDVNVTEAERRRIARIVAARDYKKRIERGAVVAAQPPEVIEWDVAGMMPRDDAPALIFGPPAAFKTWISLHLCDSVVSGRPFLGTYDVTRRAKVLYVNVDAGPKTFRNRVRRIGGTPGFDFISLSAVEFADIGLRELLAGYRGGFVIIDCLAAIYNPPDGDPAAAMRTFVDGLRNDYANFDCGGGVLDHPHRPKEPGAEGDYYGNVQKEAAFRTMWQVNAEAKVKGEPGRAKVACRKISEGEPFTTVHAAIDFSADLIAFSATDAATVAANHQALEKRMIEWAGLSKHTFTCHNIETSLLGYRNDEKRTVFDDLIERGIFTVAGKRGSGITYRLAAPMSPGDMQPRK